jgi:hypothetical protein
MHTVDLTGRTDQGIMTIITNAGRTAEKWEAARNNLGLKNQVKTKEKALSRFRRNDRAESPKKERRIRKYGRSDRKKFKKNKQPKRDDSKTGGIDSSELQRRRSAGECLRCTWPSDRKGSHRRAECRRPVKLDKGTASFPKTKEYQKMNVAGMQLESDSEEDDSDEESEESEEENSGEESDESEDDSEEEESEGEYSDEEKEYEQEEEEEEGNWWDSPPDSQSD